MYSNLRLNNFSTWQEEEEDQAAPSHPSPLETKARCPHPPLPWYHRLCRRQGRLPWQDRFRHERLQLDQEASGQELSFIWR